MRFRRRLLYGGVVPFLLVRMFFNADRTGQRTATETTSKRAMEPVQWVSDEAWYREQASRGCCPYAKQLYEHRYIKTNYRCCTDRLSEMKPLRASGGVDYTDWLSPTSPSQQPIKVLIQGDSLAEQHFLGLLCYAWYTDTSVSLNLIDNAGDFMLLKDGVVWEAAIGKWLILRFVRENRPTNSIKVDDYSAMDVVILGGFHHGNVNALSGLVNEISSNNNETDKPAVLVVEPFPNHFPGGRYRGDGNYPNSTDPNFVCDTSNELGDPNVDLQDISGATFLPIRHLFVNRGDAHIGVIPKGTVGPGGRDCLHWCIAPGIVDAVAKETLLALRNTMVETKVQ